MSEVTSPPLEILETVVHRYEEAVRRHDEALRTAMAARERSQAELRKHREEDKVRLSDQVRAQRQRFDQDRRRALARLDDACRHVHEAVDAEMSEWLEARGALEHRLDRILAVCDDLVQRQIYRRSDLSPTRRIDREQRNGDFPVTVAGLYDEIVALYWAVIETRRALGTATTTNGRQLFTPAPSREESR